MKRRMNNIFKKDGKSFVLAMDHSAQMYSPDLKDPGHIIRECVAGGVDAFLTTYGIIKHFQSDFGNAGIIMRADGGASMIRKPMNGVYASLSNMDGTFFRGMTSIGFRPSDDDIPIATIETWLLNFSRDIYGKRITLEVHKYIRGVKKFTGGLDEVRQQIDKDVLAVQTYIDNLVADMKN